MSRPITFCLNHPERRTQGHSLCSTCYSKWLKAANPEYKQRQYERNRKYHLENRDKILASNKAYYEKQAPARRKYGRDRWANMSLDERRNVNFKGTYGISIQDYHMRVQSQNGCCALCGDDPVAPLHVDHNHTTGEVRSLLCCRCNNLIGYLETTDPMVLRKALDYACCL